jgi:hypothetical protein
MISELLRIRAEKLIYFASPFKNSKRRGVGDVPRRFLHVVDLRHAESQAREAGSERHERGEHFVAMIAPGRAEVDDGLCWIGKKLGGNRGGISLRKLSWARLSLPLLYWLASSSRL